MEEKVYNLNNLTHNQIKLIIETLLYAGSVDINSSWYKNDIEEIVELAIDLRKIASNIPLKNIYIFEEEYIDSTTKKILDYFPELLDNKPNL
jgi:hypothetical protein